MLILNSKIGVIEEKISVLENILKALNNRGFQIKSAIEWHKLTNFGGY
jgi:N6-adenosine-specific RNA methylase IME4